MVEVQHTIVADVAMGDTLWSENHARFAKFHTIQLWTSTVLGYLNQVQKVHTLTFGDHIAVTWMDSIGFRGVEVIGRDDSWIHSRSPYHKVVDQELKKHTHYQRGPLIAQLFTQILEWESCKERAG
jgi:hypothetical protein